MENNLDFKTSLPLFPYQLKGAEFLHRIGSGLLGDEMGLGKSVQALAVCERADAKKVLIFCPSSIKWQWKEEIEKFMPGSSVAVIKGVPKERLTLWQGDYRFYVVNYELLLRDFALMNAREWDIIVADEAHKISNARAKQSRMIKKLRGKRKIAMTGSPLSNRANEIWNLIDFCQPGVLGNYWVFIQRYCLKNKWGAIYGYTNLEELRDKLQKHMIRRLKIDVLPELPEKIITDIPFELSEEEKILYKKLKQEILFQIAQEDISKLENPMTVQFTLVKMLRLAQLTDSMELLGEQNKSSKIDTLKELLPEWLESSKVILYTKFSKFADILERELEVYRPLKITGEVKDREDIIKRFNTLDENKIMIITDASAYGVNFQSKCSILCFLDLPFSLGKMKQVEGRIHRIGQTKGVMIYRIIGKNTIDEHLKKILVGKEKLSQTILGDIPFTMDDIKEMLND